jgi:hypothetical protein
MILNVAGIRPNVQVLADLENVSLQVGDAANEGQSIATAAQLRPQTN